MCSDPLSASLYPRPYPDLPRGRRRLPNQHLRSPLAFPGRAPYSPQHQGGEAVPAPGPPAAARVPSTGGSRGARLAPTCSPTSWWRQHLAMLLQLPRACASLIALALLPRCQSAVPVQGHREPKSGGVCSWRACERGPKRACARALVFPPPMAKRVQESLDI